jgi:hypothetical protein
MPQNLQRPGLHGRRSIVQALYSMRYKRSYYAIPDKNFITTPRITCGKGAAAHRKLHASCTSAACRSTCTRAQPACRLPTFCAGTNLQNNSGAICAQHKTEHVLTPAGAGYETAFPTPETPTAIPGSFFYSTTQPNHRKSHFYGCERDSKGVVLSPARAPPESQPPLNLPFPGWCGNPTCFARRSANQQCMRSVRPTTQETDSSPAQPCLVDDPPKTTADWTT